MITPEDRVILTGHGKRFFVRGADGTLGTDIGLIDLTQIIGRNPGDRITTHSGKEMTILVPRATDHFEHAKRSGAPMLPRDIGMVIGLTGMNKEDRVLDAGTGSGIAAIFFAGVAREVTTCERREDFAEQAEQTILDAGITNVKVVVGDITSITGEFDVIHLDLGLTADHVRHAHNLLIPGGYLVCYTPFFEQMVMAYDTGGSLFSEVASHECIMRDMDRSDRGTRPSTRIGHSGYLTVARK
ncbi:MAG TPA: methyltransferase domain-containing protein [Methanospirillum sp.]|nr:methyltransferase domain-containing protein [Methanospirillum sp.]